MSMKLLIIDTETTGLTPADSTVIELGAVLFDVELRSVICQISFLLPSLTNEAEFVNRIQPELTMRVPDLTSPMAASFWAMVSEADYAVAHNSAFDRQWFGGERLTAFDAAAVDLQHGRYSVATEQQAGVAPLLCRCASTMAFRFGRPTVR